MNREEIEEFKRIYGSSRDRDLAAKYSITIPEVTELAAKLCLGKDKKRFPVERMPRWTLEEVDVLRECFGTTPNIEIAARLGRTVKSVVAKAHVLKIKKDPARLQQMGRHNVSLRRDRQKNQQ